MRRGRPSCTTSLPTEGPDCHAKLELTSTVYCALGSRENPIPLMQDCGPVGYGSDPYKVSRATRPPSARSPAAWPVSTLAIVVLVFS